MVATLGSQRGWRKRRWCASRLRRPYQGEPLTLYRLDYTKRSNPGSGVGSQLRAIAGKPIDRAGPERAPRTRHGPGEPVRHGPSSVS